VITTVSSDLHPAAAPGRRLPRVAGLAAGAILAVGLLAGCGSPTAPNSTNGDPAVSEPAPGNNLGSGKTGTWAKVVAGTLNPNPTYNVHSDTKVEFFFPNGSADELKLRSWCQVLTMSASDVDEIIITTDGTSKTCDEIFAS